jgi:exonuclease SbcC
LELQRQELARDHDGLANRPQARTELAARRATVRTAAADVGAATAAVTEAETRVDAVQGVIDLMLSLDAATMRRAIAVNQAELASAAEQEARAAWRAGLAGELAAGLTPDEPCPVCGSRKHPAPAIASDDHVTAEQVEAVEAGRRDAERQLQDAHAAWQSLTEQLKTRQEAAGGLGGLEAQDLLTKAQRRLQVAQEAAEELPGIEAEYEQFDQATLALREELAEREIAVATAATQLTARADTLRDDEATVADAGCGYPSVVARQERLQRAAKQLQDLSDAEGVAKQARGVVKATSADLIQAAADAGFDTPVAAAAARRTPAQREGLETEIQAHTEAQAVVRQGLAEPRIQAAATAEVPDLPALRQAAESAAAVLVEANRNHETAVRLATGAADAVEEVQRAIHLSAEVRAECEPIIRVADLANASTTDAAHRTTLASYVLLRRFDEMVAAANVRLDVMSGSRFALERSEEREGGERKRGLGLIVRDHTTGSPRSPGNISGGETFVVSLALALGLADVVQAEAGGVDLGTLFVDEGFGSLDPDYLDLVMTQLDELRAGGRIVGVVSHVEAMKARVPERVEVRRCADGSSTLTVRA